MVVFTSADAFIEGGAQDEKYLVVEMDEHVDSLKSIEEVEVSRAMFEIYEGGVVSHPVIPHG